MHQKLFLLFGLGLGGVIAACGGSERSFADPDPGGTPTGSGGTGGSTTAGAAGTTVTTTGSGGGGSGSGGAGTGGTSSAAGPGGSGGSSGAGGNATGGAAGSSGGQGGTGGSVVDASTDSTSDAASDAGTKSDASDASAVVDVAPDRPKSCVGPPKCSAGASQVSCTGIRGCSWSQCTFRIPNTGVACGAEGQDRALSCPPGCRLATNGNCVGSVSGDYYGSPDACGAASRQTQNGCTGVGSVWQMCSWLPAVQCVGQPVRTDCSGIMDAIICAQEGCSWE